MKPPLNVAITGAAGQIGYALAFRVASGAMLGADQPVNLHLLEITPALPSLGGIVMELNDCAFATLNKVMATDDAQAAFRDGRVVPAWNARTCCWPTRRSSPRRARRSMRWPIARYACWWLATPPTPTR